MLMLLWSILRHVVLVKIILLLLHVVLVHHYGSSAGCAHYFRLMIFGGNGNLTGRILILRNLEIKAIIYYSV